MKHFILIFTLCVFAGYSQAQTDGCGGTPTTLSIASSCSNQSFSVPGSFNNGGVVEATCGTSYGNDRDDGWMKVTATSTQTTITGTSDQNFALAVYPSCPTAASQAISCSYAAASSANSVSFSSVNGTTYYVQLHRRGGNNTASMAGTICAVASTPAAGSICGSATTLTPGVQQCGTNSSAGSFPDDASSPVNPCDSYYNDGEYWFKYTGTGSALNLALSGLTATYSGIFVLNACPGTGTCIASAVAGSSSANYSLVTPTLTNGQTYYICIANWSTPYSTNFCLDATAISVPANDNCSGALVLTPGASCSYTAGTSLGATQSQAGCTGTADDDVWYKFVATQTSHLVTVDGAASYDGVVEVFSGTCGGTLTSLECRNLTNTDGIESTAISNLTVGQTYFVRVYHQGTGSSSTPTFNICISVPIANDNCEGAITLVPGAGSTCSYTSGSSAGATQSLSGCAGNADDDVWYKFVATSTYHQVTVDGGTNFNTVLQLYSGSCASLTSLNCNNLTGQDGIEVSTLTGLTIGQTYYMRIHHNAAGASASGFQVCITTIANYCNVGTTVPITLPYSASGLTTCGAGNEITTSTVTNVCGDSYYYSGEDAVYTFTPATSGSITVTMTSTSSYVGLVLFNDCPISGGTCTASAQGIAGSQSFCANVVSGNTYYLVVDSWSSPDCHPSYSLSVSAPSAGASTGATCASAVNISLPYNATGESTSCMGNDYTNASTGSCGTFYESGEDKVYKFTTTSAQCMTVELTNTSSTAIGYQVYSGCPGSGGTTCVANGGGATSGTLSGSFTVPSAGTYYLVVDSWSTPFNVNYDISINTLGSAPGNDLPCNATALVLGMQASGDNNCSGSSGEATSQGCWTSGAINSVWYSVVVPASGSIKIKTNAGSLFDTQIKAYSGTCSALTEIGCNDDAADCGYNETQASELSLTGLTAGNTIFIRVDGGNSLMGSFSIVVIDATSTYPSSPGQDCGLPNPVCNQTLTVSNPGYNGYGNSCDLPLSYCLEDGERSVVWYTLPMNANGTLSFDIVPNDFNCSLLDETDYDFAVWKLNATCDGSASNGYCCTEIFSGSAVPVSCNYDYLGVTGMGTSGNAPSSLNATICPTCSSCSSYNPSLTYNDAYESSVAVSSGDIYIIAISNYSNSTSGFRVDFKTTPIDYSVGTNTGDVTWSGGDLSTPTIWTDVDNWGGCTAPSCTRDAYIAAFSNQPVLANGVTYSGKNVTIQAGATLTLNANSVLELCGDFINYGSIDMHPTATIRFIGSDVQNLSGNLTGTNKLGNLVILKTAGQVNLLNHVEVGGNFTTSNSTSIFNSNNNIVTLAGNFTNNNGNSTYTTTGAAGTLEFNGSGAQTYNEGSSQLDLNFVLMNNTAAAGSGVTLATNMFIKTGTGTLTLNSGTITTSANRVDVANTSANAVSAGSAISYVDGNLRRYLSSTGIYEWPVGNVAKGYQRAKTTFSSCSIGYIDSRFDVWPGTPPIQGGTDCATTFAYEAENNGYWTLTANTGTAAYNMTLYPLNATNTAGMAGWTVMKKPSMATGTWTLNGSCVASTATVVNRNTMSGFSVFGVAQSITPLPMELLSFTGRSEGTSNYLEWVTASEINNDYFTLERSANGFDFSDFATVDGAGNSNMQLHYNRYDHTPYFGITYYRLRQTDFNGALTYSNIIALTNGLDEVSMGNVHPNPTSGDVSFDFYSPVNGYVTVRLMDNTGRIVLDQLEHITQDQTKINLMMNHLAKGIYTLEVYFDKTQFTSVVKVVKN